MRRMLINALIPMLFLTINMAPCSAAPAAGELKIINNNANQNPKVLREELKTVNPRPLKSEEETDIHPIRIMPVVRGNGWKTDERFEISNIEGIQDPCNAEEQISFTVEGKSDKFLVEEGTGFGVSATIFDRSIKAGHRAAIVRSHAEVEYDSEKHIWQVKVTAPKVSNDKYAVAVHLFCVKKDSPCAETYGIGTQVSKIVPLQVL